ncbi:hypothetical protein J27TS7_57270 [Paenibacillus dendritiformis]|uniref:DUF2264 domain-containing protein n=1 Tax=Paenibacillus dendritiformis TaxID=130049 RepID=UPI001B035788|nr:DUF2264 domain-containing protein [Paenibacillus dendritiformis]GIO76213.1 hypothetical protein J27TS7_57270 [Paenibacillus dendritiformis]
MIEEMRRIQWNHRDDIAAALLTLVKPLRPRLAEQPGHLALGTHGTVYTASRRDAEGFLRILWGLGPFLVHYDDEQLRLQWMQGLAAGCNPDSEHYYGKTMDGDQLLVEMASVAAALLLAPHKTWDVLSETDQQHVADWLWQINERRLPPNNWHFFRILVNVALKRLGKTYSQEMIEQDFALIESCYVGDGWYFDGVDQQFDYYIPWAFHYYSLIYVTFMADEDPERAARLKERAILFARSYQYWFDSKGEAVPFGRSLAYRFAQASFWSALVLADVEALPWGVIKGLYARNMRSWMNHPIFTADGVLSVGYHYQNLVMGEGYNGAGSPYWAFKSFLLLAVSDDHPYWQAEEVEQKVAPGRLSLPSMKAMIEHTHESRHVLMYPAGQFIGYQNHACAKYSKFAYSTVFGFSVPRSNYYYYEGAFDSVLAVSEDGVHYRDKPLDTSYELHEDRLVHNWQPQAGVTIRSTIVPCGDSHVRIHELETSRALIAYDASFSAPFATVSSDGTAVAETSWASYDSPVGTTIAKAVTGFTQAEMIRTEPNTNLFYERTLMPALRAELQPGTHVLVSVMAGVPAGCVSQLPEVKLTEDRVIVHHNEQTITVKLK